MNLINEMYRDKVPQVTFKVREMITPGEYGWKDRTTDHFFKNKTVVLFSLPGAFTPTCSSTHLPGYEEKYNELKKYVDEVYCISVNDSFVMNSWAKDLGCQNVRMIPDGNGHFTKKMGMLVNKEHLGFGQRSWRYSALVKNGAIMKMFVEPGKNDKGEDFDPFEVSDVDTMLAYLKG